MTADDVSRGPAGGSHVARATNVPPSLPGRWRILLRRWWVNRQRPTDRGCRWCQALPGEFCEYDCGSPAPVLHPNYRRQWPDGAAGRDDR